MDRRSERSACRINEPAQGSCIPATASFWPPPAKVFLPRFTILSALHVCLSNAVWCSWCWPAHCALSIAHSASHTLHCTLCTLATLEHTRTHSPLSSTLVHTRTIRHSLPRSITLAPPPQCPPPPYHPLPTPPREAHLTSHAQAQSPQLSSLQRSPQLSR